MRRLIRKLLCPTCLLKIREKEKEYMRSYRKKPTRAHILS